jgi:SAM-dependent methyltransferase
MRLPFRYDFRQRFLYGVQCPTCALVSLHPPLSDAEISGLYAEEYFTECSDTIGAHGRRAYMEDAQRAAARHGQKAAQLDRLLRSRLPERGHLLEVGCGPGFLLAQLRELGWTVSGLEISEFAAQHAREKLGLAVSVGPLENATCSPDTIQAAYMGDVLEHLPRPLQSLQAVRTWMQPGGVLVVEVPSTMNAPSARLGMWVYRQRRAFKTLRIPPYHLCEYVPDTLRAMLAAAGFEVITVRQSTVPLRRMALRGSFVENAGKAALQIVAHVTTRLLNRGGDRLLALAVKPGS